MIRVSRSAAARCHDSMASSHGSQAGRTPSHLGISTRLPICVLVPTCMHVSHVRCLISHHRSLPTSCLEHTLRT